LILPDNYEKWIGKGMIQKNMCFNVLCGFNEIESADENEGLEVLSNVSVLVKYSGDSIWECIDWSKLCDCMKVVLEAANKS